MSAGEAKSPTADDRVAAIEKRLKDDQDARSAAEKAATVTAAKAQIAEEIKAAGDTYELINATGNHDLVWEAMQAYFDEHGSAPAPADVAAAVEKHLEEELLEKAAKSKKFQARVGAIRTTTASKGAAPHQQSTGAVTLTNTDTPEVPSSDDDFPANPREREKAVLRSLSGRV